MRGKFIPPSSGSALVVALPVLGKPSNQFSAMSAPVDRPVKTLIARIISIVGHPFVLLPLLIFLPGFQNDRGGAFRTTLIFCGIVLIPLALLIWRCRASGEWRTVDASDKADRPVLYKSALLVLGVVIVYFSFVERSPEIVRGCIVSAAMLVLAAGLNRWIKISLHITFACFCGVVLTNVRLGFGLPVLLLVPPLIWSRLVLSRHVISETIGGLVLGLLGAACFLWR